jgi:hypothetical protein
MAAMQHEWPSAARLALRLPASGPANGAGDGARTVSHGIRRRHKTVFHSSMRPYGTGPSRPVALNPGGRRPSGPLRAAMDGDLL